MVAGTQRQLLWIPGYLPLTLGARIELSEPKMDAEVVRVRLRVADSKKFTSLRKSNLVLDVMLIEPGEFTDRP
jgi:hypothetical protein